MGVAPISLMSILPVYSGVNIHERNECHVPLFSDYSSASKHASATLRLSGTVCVPSLSAEVCVTSLSYGLCYVELCYTVVQS